MRTDNTRSCTTGQRGWILLITGLITASLVAALRWMPALLPDNHTAPLDQAPRPPTREALMAALQARPEDYRQRGDATPAPAPIVAPLPFERQIDRLVELGQATAAAVQDDEIEQAKANDAMAREAFAALLLQFPDGGERALAMLAGLPPDSALPLDLGRHAVLQLVIAAECASQHETAEAVRDRSRIDPFVGALLAVMPQHGKIAQLGEAVLGGKPYLRLIHEPAVLDLVRLAGEERFARATATRLLLTLWDNLRRTGERTSAELASMAMLLLADPDPCKRTAACRQLLGDPRYRHVVLAWLREHKERTVSAEIATLAAQELPPKEALAVLRELAPMLTNVPAAYMSLGYRAPEVLVDAYHELLAANTHATVRSDLIAGLAMANAPESTPAVELALQSDPSPEVRVQAMLSLTATAAATHGEAACNRVLDDPCLASDPARLAVVVFALQNLEVAGLANAVDRLGQRLRNTPLREDTRRALELLLARALPGGQTSR